MLTQDQIKAIAVLPANAYKYKAHIDNLIALYAWCREQWTAKAIKDLTRENNLDLRRKEDRARFGWYAAQELVKALPPSPPPSNTGLVKVLSQAIAMLPPVPQTNGLENAPAYQILGSPIYADELHRNYRQLVQRWHPDTNPSLEALGRFQLVTEIYQTLRDKWFEKYSPLIPGDRIGKENISLAMAKTFPFTPSSFW